MSESSESLRTIALAGNIDAGSSTLGRRMARLLSRSAGGMGRSGREDGTLERAGTFRGTWAQHPVELVGTVGPLRFTRDGRGAVPPLSGAVLVLDAVAGVQRQTYTADRRIRRYRLPRLAFINKCDRAGADPERLCRQLRERLVINPVLLQLPFGREERFVGVLDLVAMQALRFAGNDGEHPIVVQIPDDLRDAAEFARTLMLDTLAMYSDELGRELDRGEVTPDLIHRAIRDATVDLKATPVLLGSAFKSKGVQPLLDAIVNYLPAPPRVRARAKVDLAPSEPSMPSLDALDAQPPPSGDDEESVEEPSADRQPPSGPLRILEQTHEGDLRPGQLGVVMARAGEGKSGCMVRMGLDYLMRGSALLHVGIGETAAQIKTRYRSQIGDLFPLDTTAEKRARMELIGRRFTLRAVEGASVEPEELRKMVADARALAAGAPLAILIDGHRWAGPLPRVRRIVKEIRAVAADASASLWVTVVTRRAMTGAHPTSLPPAVEDFDDLIDLAIFLEPRGRQTTVRLLHDAAGPHEGDVYLVLDRTVTVIDAELVSLDEPALTAGEFTLLSGGAPGAEAEFGDAAERWGVVEVTFSFPGRAVSRQRGLVELSEAELTLGDVSDGYLRRHLPRSYREDPAFRRVIQTIWHQVVGAGQLFVVGTILGDGTVAGGTGWAVELARRWRKDVHVFDQGTSAWFSWRDGSWQRVAMLTISARRFAGTGTQELTDAGRKAIHDLFAATFADTTV